MDAILFGAIAVAEQFLAPDRLEAALAEQREPGPPRRIGEILKARGWLTEEQIQIILDIQRVNVADRVESAHGGDLLGELAVASGYCLPDDIAAAVRAQGELASADRRVRIGQILVQHGRLVPDQLADLLRQQEKFIVKCPGCARWSIVDGLDESPRLFCRRCLRVVPVPVLPGAVPDAPEFVEREARGERFDRVPCDSAGRFGPFAIETEILRTGATAMFRALNVQTRHLVTLRVLQTSQAPDSAEAMKRAAEPLTRLSHDHLAEFLECGLVDAQPYVATEYLDGASLASVLARRRTPREQLVRFLEQAARAVGHAHREGVVHGLLRPANILIGHRFEPRVLDTGVAPLVSSLPFVRRDTLAFTSYSAPELTRGGSAGTRADVYALGIMLHEALGGRPPRPPRAPSIVPDPAGSRIDPLPEDVPAGWRAIAARATAQRPGDRYADAVALADDLLAALEGRPLSRPPSKWPGRLLLAGTALVIALILLVLLRR